VSGHLVRNRVLLVSLVCLAAAVFAQPAWSAAQAVAPPNLTASQTKTAVACKKLSQKRVRCTMALKGGAAISGTVSMRIKRGTVVVARGHGQLKRGKATLTMHVLAPMTAGSYTVTMVITKATIRAKKVLTLG
jgi:hypothetical protein